MKGNNYLWLSAALVLASIILGCCAVSAVRKAKSYERTVSVKGLCEKEVKADRVIWPITYKIGGNDLSYLNRQIKEKNDIIINYLKNNGIKDDEITVSVPEITDNRANNYSSDALYNYVVASAVTVCTNNVDRVIELETSVPELIEKGVPVGTGNSWEHQTDYSFNGLNDIKPGMIEEATVNAREVAEKFAKDSKSKLGKIKTATQGQFSITDRDQNTPYIKNVRVVTNVIYYLDD